VDRKQEFIDKGFTVLGEENKENKLIAFLKEHYPSVIKDNEIDLQELKAIAGLPIDEKVNGYGLNFIGRNVARAKYAQKTNKELKLNVEMSKNIDTTQNLVLKGDNLDCLKILKNYYSGKIKCIYIDPPYNTDSDEFIYPDKFDKEEAEVLGLQNLSDEDFARMEFSFKTKKSHNGWLSFMYPRLLLARDLLSDDGVIFISIDDNEQANLKLLCDDVFGEENFVGNFLWQKKKGGGNDSFFIAIEHEYIISYIKNKNCSSEWFSNYSEEYLKRYKLEDENGKYFWDTLARPGLTNPIKYKIKCPDKTFLEGEWVISENRFYEDLKNGKIRFTKLKNGNWSVHFKQYLGKGKKPRSLLEYNSVGVNADGKKDLLSVFHNDKLFDNPKPKRLINYLISIVLRNSDIILDFFAGSGTTGHAVMQLNAEDGGNRKFILVQIDEPIKEDKPAYNFCIENNLPPVISSITIERLKRAGEKIKKEIEEENSKVGMFEENKKKVPDIGFKVFDTVEAPKLELDESNNILFPEIKLDPISRIYNMIFTVGLDEPTQVPKEVVKDCVYKTGNNYYITNSEKVSKEQFAECIKNGKVFIDGWTASLNATLQYYKEDVKIVF